MAKVLTYLILGLFPLLSGCNHPSVNINNSLIDFAVISYTKSPQIYFLGKLSCKNEGRLIIYNTENKPDESLDPIAVAQSTEFALEYFEPGNIGKEPGIIVMSDKDTIKVRWKIWGEFDSIKLLSNDDLICISKERIVYQPGENDASFTERIRNRKQIISHLLKYEPNR